MGLESPPPNRVPQFQSSGVRRIVGGVGGSTGETPSIELPARAPGRQIEQEMNGG